MAARIQIENLQPAKEPVLCRADVHIDIGSEAVAWSRLVTLKGCSLYRAKGGDICLGVPQRNYQGNDGKTRYEATVELPRATALHALDALKVAWEASRATDQPELQAEAADPFSEP